MRTTSRMAFAMAVTLSACAVGPTTSPRGAAGPGDGSAAGSQPTPAAQPTGWYEAAPGHAVLVSAGPEGGLRLLDFDSAAFTSLTAGADSSWTWTIDGLDRVVRFERDDSGLVRALRWSDAAGPSGRMPRVASPPFEVREIAFRADTTRLAGLLLQPPRAGRAGAVPGAVIIHGSGDSDRDNVWAFHIAQHIARSGVAVLFPDKRGSGASGGNWRSADFDVLAADALAGVEFLRQEPGVDAACIGLVGLSQGGWVAPLAATRDSAIGFVVDVSGAAVAVQDQLRHEIRQDLAAAGFDAPTIEHALDLFALADAHAARPDSATWTTYAAALERMHATSLRPFAEALPADPAAWWWSWWGGVRDFDPLPLWRRLAVPSLVVYGQDDESDNVPVAESVRRLGALERADLQIRVYEGSGHALGDDATGWIRRDFLDLLADWTNDVCGRGQPTR